MSNILEIPLLNPLRPVLQTMKVAADSGTIKYYAYNPQYNSLNTDDGFYIENLKFYEDKNNYIQPFQQSDTLRLQWFSTDITTANFTVQILDSQGKVYTTTTVTQETGSYNGMYLYTIKLYLYNIPEGNYFVRIRYKHTGTTYSYVLFEPFNVKQIQDNTVRIDYSNSYNDQNVVYPSNFKFQLRVKGCITEVSTESKFNVYENQPFDLEMVAGIPYRIYELTFGVGKGIPEWLSDKLERAFLCDNTYVDGKLYTRNEGSKIEAKKTIGNPLSQYTLKLRDRTNPYTSNYGMLHKSLGTLPQTKYFWVNGITINGVSQTVNKQFAGARNFIDYLNAVLLPYDGYFAEDVSHNLIFVSNGTAISGTWTFSNYLEYGIRLTIDGAGDFEFDMLGNNLQTYRVVYGDGSSDLTGTFNGTTPVSVVKTYTGTTKKYMYIFSTNMTYLSDTATTCKVTAIAGDLPSQFVNLDFNAQGTNNGLNIVENNIFTKVLGLTYLGLDNQNLSTSAVNDIIQYLYDSVTHLDASCVVHLDDQNPSAAPTYSPGIAEFIYAIKQQITTFVTD